MDPHMTTDAAVNEFYKLERTPHISDDILTLEKVGDIEKELDLYEKVHR